MALVGLGLDPPGWPTRLGEPTAAMMAGAYLADPWCMRQVLDRTVTPASPCCRGLCPEKRIQVKAISTRSSVLRRAPR